MIRSMTGFGLASGSVGGDEVTAELRSVNHRFFSPSIKLPNELSRWEGDVRDVMRKRMTRGHVTLVVRAERPSIPLPVIDEGRFGGYVAQLRALQERFGLGGTVDVATVLRMPDIFAAGERSDGVDDATELITVVDRAIDALTTSRTEEGGRLAAYLLDRLGWIDASLARIAARAPERVIQQRDRLRAQVKGLTEGLGVDEQRIAQEIAILADRLDVSEELSRFASHLSAFRAALAGEEGVGKRLGFLTQEMLREANTTGSKANDAIVLQDVIRIKEELERVREQVENLE
ncbi:MAG: YicC family protein [Gemmatimonadaceae bacterium]